MNISPLQKARYEYTPKLPGMLRNGIADICVKEGEETQSVADQEKIKALLADFDYLSVRELPAKEELENFIGEKDRVKVVIDPSLLLDPSDYDPICAERRVDKPYIFLYSFLLL